MVRGGSLRFGRRVLAAAVAGVALVAVTPAPAQASSTFACRYVIDATLLNGFMADLYITNYGPVTSSWTAHWTFHNPAQLVNAWQAVISQPTPLEMTAVNASFNGTIQTSQTASFGWTAFSSTAEIPTDITVNGQPC